MKWWDQMPLILFFWMSSFKPNFSPSPFTFIKRLFSYSSLSAIRVVSSAYYKVIDISPSNLDSSLCFIQPAWHFSWWLSDFTFTFHFHALEKEMATHSSVPAWRIPGTGEPSGLMFMGSHRVRHDWSDLAAAPSCWYILIYQVWNKHFTRCASLLGEL